MLVWGQSTAGAEHLLQCIACRLHEAGMECPADGDLDGLCTQVGHSRSDTRQAQRPFSFTLIAPAASAAALTSCRAD